MRRTPVAVVALILVSLLVGVIPQPTGAQEATLAATPATEPQPPAQPTSGPGSSEAFFGGMTSIEEKPPGEFFADYWLFVPADPLPGTTLAEEPFPLVIFVHGSGATGPDLYLAWIEHLVRRGAVVLYPLYQSTTYREAEYRQALLDGVTRALERLEREGVPVDPTRVAVVGHSLGGGLAVDYAASATAARLPVPAAVMSIAPGCASTEVACIGADLGAIAPTSRILLVTAADDPDRIGTLTVERIWAGLGGCRWKTGTW